MSNDSTPVILHNTPFSSWKSVNWTFDLLADLIPSVVSKTSKTNVFRYYAVDKPFSEVPEFKEKKEYQTKKYPGKKYFHALKSPAHKEQYNYASGSLELLQINDVFTNDSLSRVTFGNFEPGEVNFWFGSEGVTAYTHYDTSHNLHTIIQGRKKFIIFPPSAYKYLKLYPSIHTFYRQVQVDILNLTQQEYRELLFETSIVEVVLRRGETLYIPPYWFHCVVTLQPTISLNVWSQSEAFLSMEDIYALPIPFEEQWGRVKLLRALQHFATLLVQDTLPHFTNVSHFVNVELLSRYGPIFSSLSEENRTKMLSTVQVYCLQGEVTELLEPPQLRHVIKATNKISDIFKGMFPLSVREINIVNYLEHVAWMIVGTDDVVLVPFYYKKCLAMLK